MVKFLAFCSAMGLAVMMFGLASLRSDIQITIALLGGFSCAILAGLAAILHRLPPRPPESR